MIHYIGSSLPRFKTVSFHAGLNVILAEKTEHSTQRQTRNGAGKTSLVEIVHFLLGASAGTGSMFRIDALVDAQFEMRVDVGENDVTVRRSGSTPSRIGVTSRRDADSATSVLTNEEWKTLLGEEWFGLARDNEKNAPSTRSLLSYFARRQESGGFDGPFSHTRQQQRADQQVNVSYLLGLDWQIARDWQDVRDSERSLRELRRAVSEGIFTETVGDIAGLRTELAVAERSSEALKESLASFHVVEQYRELEVEASELTRQIGALADENTADRLLVATLDAAIESEQAPELGDLRSLYSEVGVVLPDASLRRYDEVVAFHESVVRNRRQYLANERSDAISRLTARTEAMRPLDERRGTVVGILRTGGALDHYTALETELSRRTAHVEAIRRRFEAAQRFEASRAALALERSELELRLQRDFTERAALLDRAIVVFEELSGQLYEERAGSLTIRESPDGPQFSVEMHAKRSKGIRQMQIFCFDLMMMTLCSERGIGPGFLIHDSHLFDGVDSRQVGKALELGARSAEALGFQYIVTMNSDALPAELPEGFNPSKYVLPVAMTDAGQDGGLFGIRFQ